MMRMSAQPVSGIEPTVARQDLTVDAVYDLHFEFVWRTLRRLGVPLRRMDDAAQDVFLVVHRKLPEFQARSSLRTWLFGIVVRVVHDYHRSQRRKEEPTRSNEPFDPDSFADERDPGPLEQAERAAAIRMFEELMANVSEEKREVFLLTEFEQMTAPEIAQAIGIEVSTVYSRLRAARLEFEQAIARRKNLDSRAPKAAGPTDRAPIAAGRTNGGQNGSSQ
jgi:RNA polymerase sigma-70 factor (ECF subfamily)